jgi:hypothetical protein
MHPQLNHIATQHIADLQRTADRHRLVHAAASATSSHAVPAPRHTPIGRVPFLRWLRHPLA